MPFNMDYLKHTIPKVYEELTGEKHEKGTINITIDGNHTTISFPSPKDKLDEFELAGFDEETCYQLRKISAESGIAPKSLIDLARQHQTEPHTLTEYEKAGIAWDIFKQKLWDEFIKSKIGKFTIRLADKLAAWLERFRK